MAEPPFALFEALGVRDLEAFSEPDAALRKIETIYQRSVARLQDAFARFSAGEPVPPSIEEARYPFVGLQVGRDDLELDAPTAFGVIHDPGVYGTTLTRPGLFRAYYRRQLDLLISYHRVPVVVGVSPRPLPLPFVIETAVADLRPDRTQALQASFPLPEMSEIDDRIANGTYRPAPGMPKPLALFTAERVDYSIERLVHYTDTSAEHFQRFVLLTNYQRYVERFVELARREVLENDTFASLVEPGDVIWGNPRYGNPTDEGEPPRHLPQMPACHLTRPDRTGITMINIGIGPSNAKTITDHLAVLRPHCWLMLGHCAGLRRSQRLGDYVLAHAYAREDRVLDRDLPLDVAVPPIAEVQVALQQAVVNITGLRGPELKTRMRTGTVASTDNRNWELRFADLGQRLNQHRAIAVDMESATIAANGFRLRVPYGTLLCVSDKPLHGELKLRGMANAFYRERVEQHLLIGLEAIRILRDEVGPDALHSRKLRSFDEPAFR